MQCAENRSFPPTCDCKFGYYEANLICAQCSLKCKQCVDEHQCTQCSSHRINPPVCQCENQFYELNQQCKSCPLNCLKCQNNDFCDVCLQGYYRLNQKCLEQCPQKYFNENGNCLECHRLCQTCKGNSQFDCLSCVQAFQLYNGYCQPCRNSNNLSGICQNCHADCLTCQGEQNYQCTTCQKEKGVRLFRGLCVQKCVEIYKECLLCIEKGYPCFSDLMIVESVVEKFLDQIYLIKLKCQSDFGGTRNMQMQGNLQHLIENEDYTLDYLNLYDELLIIVCLSSDYGHINSTFTILEPLEIRDSKNNTMKQQQNINLIINEQLDGKLEFEISRKLYQKDFISTSILEPLYKYSILASLFPVVQPITQLIYQNITYPYEIYQLIKFISQSQLTNIPSFEERINGKNPIVINPGISPYIVLSFTIIQVMALMISTYHFKRSNSNIIQKCLSEYWLYQPMNNRYYQLLQYLISLIVEGQNWIMFFTFFSAIQNKEILYPQLFFVIINSAIHIFNIINFIVYYIHSKHQQDKKIKYLQKNYPEYKNIKYPCNLLYHEFTFFKKLIYSCLIVNQKSLVILQTFFFMYLICFRPFRDPLKQLFLSIAEGCFMLFLILVEEVSFSFKELVFKGEQSQYAYFAQYSTICTSMIYYYVIFYLVAYVVHQKELITHKGYQIFTLINRRKQQIMSDQIKVFFEVFFLQFVLKLSRQQQLNYTFKELLIKATRSKQISHKVDCIGIGNELVVRFPNFDARISKNYTVITQKGQNYDFLVEFNRVWFLLFCCNMRFLAQYLALPQTTNIIHARIIKLRQTIVLRKMVKVDTQNALNLLHFSKDHDVVLQISDIFLREKQYMHKLSRKGAFKIIYQ